MRILHTSDWHLGRSLHREALLPAQAQFLDWMVETAVREQVDAVVVSGDVYDRALPAVDAVRLLDDVFDRLYSARIPAVVTSGNHDSRVRLGFNRRPLAAAGLHLRTEVADCAEPVLLADAHGLVAVYGLPYLEPDAVRDELGCTDAGHQPVLREAMRRVRADLAARPRGTRSVVLAHAFVAGASASESERDISVGGALAVPASTFAGVDYVALGHLHGPQTLAPGVRYSGSPLAYSFSEATHTKSVWLVDLGPDGLEHVEAVPCPVPRALSSVRGTLDDLLRDPSLAAVASHYLSVTLTDPIRPREPMERLRARFPHTLVLTLEPAADGSSRERYGDRVRGRSDLEVAQGFVEHVRGEAADDAETALLRAAFEAGRLAEVNV